uniref:cilia- and flagella-associated protein 65 n=1 Tax=Myxine glutinosa TaxID=7769 RepID=UPI00358F95A4
MYVLCEQVEYEDQIEFSSSQSGTFFVTLHGTIPKHCLQLPNDIQFGLVPVFQVQRLHFNMHNVSQLPTSFYWDVCKPFQLEPAEGILAARTSRRVTASLCLATACYLHATATCHYGDVHSMCHVLTLEARGKYPFLTLRVQDSLSEDHQDTGGIELHFKAVPVNFIAKKHVIIDNPSAVCTVYYVCDGASDSASLSSPFTWKEQEGSIEAGGMAHLTIHYSPKVVGMASFTSLHVCIPGNRTQLKLKIKGQCLGPQVFISQPTMCIGVVPAGGKKSHVAELKNGAAVAATFYMLLDTESNVFSVEPTSGVVKAWSSLLLRFTFQPESCLSYHVRAACIVHHQGPVFLDLLGTCHSADEMPPLLVPCQLDLANSQQLPNLSHWPPFTVPFKGISSLDHAPGALQPIQMYQSGLSSLRCLALKDSGSQNDHLRSFSPPGQGTVNPVTLVFPAVIPGNASYRTLLLRNPSCKPLSFFLICDACPGLTAWPACGTIPVGGLLVCVLRANPSHSGCRHFHLPVCFDHDSPYAQYVEVTIIADEPRVETEGGKKIFFIPTCLGLVHERDVSMQNTCALPLHFRWTVPQCKDAFLSVMPVSGNMLPGEEKSCTWQFEPRKERKFVLSPKLLLWPSGSPTETEVAQNSKYQLQIHACCTKGSLTAESSVIDLGIMAVGDTKMEKVTIINNGSCDLTFVLSIAQRISKSFDPCRGTTCKMLDPQQVSSSHHEPIDLMLSETRGHIPVRCKLVFLVAAGPTRQGLYSWTICWQPIDLQGRAITTCSPQEVCQVCAEVVLPMLEITDVYGTGSMAASMSKQRLWNHLNLGTLNSLLRTDQTTQTLSPRYYHMMNDAEVIVMDLGAAPIGCEQCAVTLVVENTGIVPTEWLFCLPGDLTETDIEPEDGSPRARSSFNISPQRGYLQPEQKQSVCISYRHDSASVNHELFLLKVENGRQVLFDSFGTTVESDQLCLHVPLGVHYLFPVSISCLHPPVQFCEIHNRGTLPLSFEIQTDVLFELQENNFSHAVLECLTPRGQIPGTSSFLLQWLFSPLEPKTYLVDVKVCVEGVDAVNISLCCVGYDDKILADMETQVYMEAATAKPTARVQMHPCQLLQMSPEFIDFGHVLLHGRVRRIIFLRNPSPHKHIMFSWRATHALMKKYLSVDPQHGVLKPHESQVCCVTFHAVGCPAILKRDIVCQVIDMEEHKRFVWQTSSAVSLVSKIPHTQPLYLGVMVQTHAKPDFCTFFLGIQEAPVISSIESFMVEIQDEVLMKTEVPLTNNWMSEELIILPDIFAKIIQSLLYEKEFQHVLKEISAEPILVFEQFRSQSSSSHLNAALLQDKAPQVEHGTRSEMNGARHGEVLPLVCKDQVVDKLQPPQLRPLKSKGKDRVKRYPEFAAILLGMVEETVQNVIAEAGRGEATLTSCHRFITCTPHQCHATLYTVNSNRLPIRGRSSHPPHFTPP